MSKEKDSKQNGVEETLGTVSNKVEEATKGVDTKLDGITTWIEKQLKQLPVFPKGVADWFGKYAWILAAVFGVIGLLSSLNSLFNIDRLLNPLKYSVAGEIPQWLSRVIDIQLSPMQQLSLVLGVVSSLLVSLIYIVAIVPLKNNRNYGWKLLLWAMYVSLAFTLVSAILTISFSMIISLVFTALFATIGFWILFGIKGKFTKK